MRGGVERILVRACARRVTETGSAGRVRIFVNTRICAGALTAGHDSGRRQGG